MSNPTALPQVRAYRPDDQAAVVALWDRCGLLVNPLNDPMKDIALCRDSGHGDILVLEADGRLFGAVMVGHDGHRGWMYYLGVDPDLQRGGLGRRLVRAAEAWWKERGLPKGHLMVRDTNTGVIGFYQRAGYRVEPTATLSKRLDGVAMPAGGQRNDEPIITTYLEMTARPNLPLVVPTVKHHALLGAQGITVSFYRYLYDAVGRPWYWTDRKTVPDAELAEILADPDVDVFVAYADGTPAGYFELDGREKGVIDLAYFGIMPDFIGCRLGPWLLGQAIDMAWSREPERMTVNTCTLDHPKALPMYQRFGFVPYDRHEGPAPWARWDAAVIDFNA